MDSVEAGQMLEHAQQASVHLLGPTATQWLDLLEREHDRLHAALVWFIQHDRGADAVALVAGIWRQWLVRGGVQEGREWLDAALQASQSDAPSGTRSRALYGAGLLAFRQGETDLSRQLNEASLAEARAVSDKAAMVDALMGLARVALRAGDFALVRTRCEEGMSIARALGERSAEVLPLHLLAAVMRMEGNYAAARSLYRDSIQLNSELSDQRMVAMEQLNMGSVEVLAGAPRDAEPHLREALHAIHDQDASGLIPICLIALASVATAQGNATRAARLLGAADAALARTSTTLDPDDQPLYDTAVEQTQSALGVAAFTAERATGHALTLDAATCFALGE